MLGWRGIGVAVTIGAALAAPCATAAGETAPVPGTLALAGATANWAAAGTIAQAVGAVGTPLKGDGLGAAFVATALPDAARGRNWTLWATGRTTRWDGAGDDRLDADQSMLVAGAGWQVTGDWLVGVLAARERLTDDIPDVRGRLEGRGNALGAYVGWSLLPTLRWDATVVRAFMDYDAGFGPFSGAFSGDRWVVSTGFTGLAQVSGVVLEPSARFYYGREQQDGVTGTLRYLTTENEVEVGRVTVGSRAGTPFAWGDVTVMPSLGAFAEWRFGQSTLVAGGPSFAPPDGWSGRLNAGLSLAHTSGASLNLVAERLGIGSDAPSWSTQAVLAIAF